MIEQIFGSAKKGKNRYIVVEMLTVSNVPIYEHFRFEMKDADETKNKKLIECRIIKESQ